MEEVRELIELIKTIKDLEQKHFFLDKLRELSRDMRLVISYIDIEGQEKKLYINDYTLCNLRQLIIHNGEFDTEIASAVTEYSRDIFFLPVSMLKVFSLNKTEEVGMFFPYYNDSTYVLDRYQIYKEDIDDTKHCLLHSLELCGVNTITIQNYIQTGVAVNRKFLKKLATKLGINIQLYTVGININRTNYNSKLPSEKVVKIALFLDHYFIQEKTEHRNPKTNRKMSSLQFICMLNAENHFIKRRKEPRYKPCVNSIGLDSYIEEQSLFTPKEQKQKENYNPCVSFADIECTTRPHHKPFMYGRMLNNRYMVFRENDPSKPWEGFKKFLNSFPSNYNIVYFHNLKYDWHVIRNCPYIHIQSVLRKEGMYYKVVFRFIKKVFELRDSYKLIPRKLSDFTHAFSLNVKKKDDFFMYELYTQANTIEESVRYEDYVTGSEFELLYEVRENCLEKSSTPIEGKEYILIDNRILVDKQIISQLPCYFLQKERKYFHIVHCMDYLQNDCVLLMKGLARYREMMLDLINIDCYKELTLASMVHRKICKNGYYQGVFELEDNLRTFVSKAAHGGRVCTRLNQMWDIKGKIIPLDGRSLYPSAITRIFDPKLGTGGFPSGKCKVISDINSLKEATYYVVCIKITKIGIKQQIPFVNYYKDDHIDNNDILCVRGGRIYTNDIEDIRGKELVVDKITLEDWIEFQDIEYEFVKGVYWSSVSPLSTDTIASFMKDVYAKRIQYSREGNSPMSEMCKLILNTPYGKTLTKANGMRDYVKNNNKSNDYAAEHFSEIINSETHPNQTIFTLHDSDLGHSNLCHIGCLILSMARRIMNEVLSLANKLDIHVYYQDTDSMHVGDTIYKDGKLLYDDGVKKLEEAYKNLYGRDLIGTQLQQFGEDLKIAGCSNVYSKRSIYLGKKAYLHCAVGYKEEVKIEVPIAKIKGVNSYAMKEYPDTIELYERMFKGETIPFDLTYGDGVSFSFKSHVTTKEKFIKNIKFDGTRNVLQ